MNRILLITRSKHDITNRYLFYWAKEVIELAEKKGIKVLDLDEKRANEKELTGIISKMKPLLIFFNGHGDNNCVRGHNDEILVKVGKNEKLLESKIIYALSCKSGKKLGPKSINNGALAYIGYDDDFIFIYNQEKISRPLNDDIAKLFFEPSNQLVNSLLKGNTVKDSYERSRNAFKANVQKLLSSDSSDTYVIPYLLWDMNHQTCLGKGKTTF